MSSIYDNPDALVEHMIGACREILSFVEGVSEEQFLADVMRSRATERGFEIIGEAANKLYALRVKHVHDYEIPWQLIRGMRNRIVHDYAGINHTLLYQTASEKVPELLEILENLPG